MTWIGVDFGCTHTSAAYSKKGISNRIIGVNVDMIPINLENGKTSTPSVAKIQTNGDPALVGNAALRAQFPWTKMTLFDSKRMIGMKVTDAEIIENQKSWPFDVVGDEDGNPLYSVPLPKTDEVKLYTPTEIASYVLTVVRQDAALKKEFINDERSCVITVPANFNKE